MGARSTPVLRPINASALPIATVAHKRALDTPAGLRKLAFDHRKVPALDAMCFEQLFDPELASL